MPFRGTLVNKNGLYNSKLMGITVNDTKILSKLLNFQCGLSLKSSQIRMNKNTFRNIDL